MIGILPRKDLLFCYKLIRFQDKHLVDRAKLNPSPLTTKFFSEGRNWGSANSTPKRIDFWLRTPVSGRLRQDPAYLVLALVTARGVINEEGNQVGIAGVRKLGSGNTRSLVLMAKPMG